MKKEKQRKSLMGFTLIELLVVIAVIGMLASIVLVALGPARARARDAKRVTDIRQISSAMELCFGDASCGGKINNDQAYQLIAAGGGAAQGRLDTTSIGSYMGTIPQDPGGGSVAACTALGETTSGAYCGFDSGVGGEYCIYATLSDGRVFAASEKGANYMTGLPGSMSACP